MADKITIEGSGKSFNVDKFQEAVKAATTAYNKSKKQITINLPPTTINVATTITVHGIIKLSGVNGTKLSFAEDALLKVERALQVENFDFVTEENKDIAQIVITGQLTGNNIGFVGTKILTEETGSVDLQACRVSPAENNSTENDGFALRFYGDSSHVLSNCEISGYSSGIIFSSKKGVLDLSESSVTSSKIGLLLEGSTRIDQVNFSSPGGTIISSSGEETVVNVDNSEFEGFQTAIRGTKESKINIKASNFDGKSEAEYGFHVSNGALVDATKTSLKDIEIACFGEVAGDMKLREVMAENVANGVLLRNEAKIEAEGLTVKNVKDVGIILESQATGVVNNGTIESCEIGTQVTGSSLLQLSKFNCKKFEKTAIKVLDAGLEVRGGKVVGSGKGNGVTVKFSSEGSLKVLLRDYVVANCSIGGYFEDAKGNEAEMKSKSTLENCLFLQCKVGCHVDRSLVDLYGSTFAMNKEHSILIYNQVLKNVGQLRKEARLRIRWLNLIEKRFDDGEQLSNNNTLFASCQEEKEFRVMQEFDSVLYRDILCERLKQAMNFFRSKDIYSMNLARVIMKSVGHCLKFIKPMKENLLQNELLEIPDLGMFAATFKLDIKLKGKNNSLIQMEDLLDSWQELRRVEHFDHAISALDEAFNRKQIDDDIYDEWITPLEEMQRDCFVKSKYNRRRDYLLDKSKKDPLSAWYFLVKEDKNTDEGKKLRKEVLHFLAASFPNYGSVNFNASWVGQWASQEMGRSFREERIPEDYNLRRAWANNLLDHGNAQELLTWYNNTGFTVHPMDQLMQYEAYKQLESVRRLSSKESGKIQKLFNGEGSNAALRTASRMFSGNGALPGFIRRTAEKARNIEEVLVFLRPAYEDVIIEKWRKERVCVATLAHFFMRDPTNSPKILGTKDVGYETCPMCFIQKLQPWNELKLSECKHNHVFCIDCLKQSMSTGSRELWGRCPGTTDAGECTAYANRREMEMSGMDNNKVFNILRVRVNKKLSELPGWRDCSHCRIGGKANVNKGYFVCKLCDNLVTEDGGESDPTVRLKLLEGLNANKSPRGKGVFRECYYCASPYEKGDACSTITCANCNKQFSMTWGNQKVNHTFDNNGVAAQRYVPLKPGGLWKLDVFKNRKGGRLKLGQQLSEAESKEVLRRAQIALEKLKL